MLPSLNSTLNKNDYQPHSQVANTCTKKRLFDDCEENEIPKNCLDIVESNFSSHSNSSCSLMATQGGSDESSATGVDKTTLFNNTVGGLCYQPLEKEDCDVYLSTGEFPSTNSFLRVPITPVSVDSSMSDKNRGTVDFSSSESILRNAAMNLNDAVYPPNKLATQIRKMEFVHQKRLPTLQTIGQSFHMNVQIQCNLSFHPSSLRSLKSLRIQNMQERAWNMLLVMCRIPETQTLILKLLPILLVAAVT